MSNELSPNLQLRGRRDIIMYDKKASVSYGRNGR